MAKRKSARQPWPEETIPYIAVLRKCLTSTYLSLDLCLIEYNRYENKELINDLMPYLIPFLDDCTRTIAALYDFIPHTRGQPPRWASNISLIDTLVLEISILLESAYKESKRRKPPIAIKGLEAARQKCQEAIELIEEVPFNKSPAKMPSAFRDFINNLNLEL